MKQIWQQVVKLVPVIHLDFIKKTQRNALVILIIMI